MKSKTNKKRKEKKVDEINNDDLSNIKNEKDEEINEESSNEEIHNQYHSDGEFNDLEIDDEEDNTKKLIKESKEYSEKLKNRAVIYISHIPPKMTPTKLKTILSSFGEVTRVYLVEENPNARKRRRKNGGNSRKKYIEGWIEFQDRKVAKQVAKELNNTPISNSKHDAHYGDIWNLKYLRKFQWSHLTEKVAYERRVREQKIRLEMMQVKKENNTYKNLVEKGEKMERIEERRAKKGKDTVVHGKKWSFHQVRPIRDDNDGLEVPVLASLVQK